MMMLQQFWKYRINWITPPPRVTTPFGLYPQVQIEKNGSPGIYPHGVILSILQLYHILIGHVQVTINLLIEVIVVIKGVKFSLRVFVILAILAIAIVAIAINTILFFDLAGRRTGARDGGAGGAGRARVRRGRWRRVGVCRTR